MSYSSAPVSSFYSASYSSPSSLASLTNFGPLTTLWSPPASCLDTITLVTNRDSTNTWYNYFVAGYYAAPTATQGWGDPSCFPDQEAHSITPAYGYFSPGICPSSYSAACGLDPGFSTGGTIASICCPTGYTCTTDYGNPGLSFCKSTVFTAVTNVWVTGDTSGFESGVPETATLTTVKTGTYTPYNYVQNNGVIVMWRGRDLGDFPTTASVPSAVRATAGSSETAIAKQTGGSHASANGTGTDTGTPAPTGSSGGGGLSGGAKAGIGVGVALGAVAVLAGAFFLWRRQKKTKDAQYAAASQDEYGNRGPDMAQYGQYPPQPQYGGPQELDNTPALAAQGPVEMDVGNHNSAYQSNNKPPVIPMPVGGGRDSNDSKDPNEVRAFNDSQTYREIDGERPGAKSYPSEMDGTPAATPAISTIGPAPGSPRSQTSSLQQTTSREPPGTSPNPQHPYNYPAPWISDSGNPMSPSSSAAPTLPPMPAPVATGGSGEDPNDELARLQKEREEIQKKKTYLQQLAELEQREQELQKRISERAGQSP